MDLWTLITTIASVVSLAFFSYLLVSGIELFAGKLHVNDYTFILMVFPIFSSLPDLIIIILNFVYAGSMGPGMALSAAVGEPFIIITIGFPALFVFSLLKFDKGNAWPFTDSSGATQKVLYVPIVLSIIVYTSIILLNRILKIVIILSALVFALYFYSKNLKEEQLSREIRASTLKAILYVILGCIGLAFFGKVLVSAILEISKMGNISPFSQSFIIFPLSAAIPEFFASFSLILKGKKNAAVASLIGEFLITAALYPALIFMFTSPALPSAVLLGMVMEIISSLVLIILSFKKAILPIASINFAIFLIYIALAF